MTRAGSEPGGVGAPKGSEEKTRKGDRYGDRKIDVRSAIEDLNTKIPPRSKDGRRSAGKRWLMDGEDTGREAVWRRHTRAIYAIFRFSKSDISLSY